MTKRQLIDERMKLKKHTNKSLADKLNYTEMTLYNIKKGRVSGDNSVVLTLAELDIDPKEWLQCKEEEV